VNECKPPGGGGIGYGGIDYGRTFRGGCGGADVAGAGLRYLHNSVGKAYTCRP